MYVTNEFNYSTMENQKVYNGSYYNCLANLEEMAHCYILAKQGDNLIKDYNELVYEYNELPNRNRQMLRGPFFIRKSKYDPNKFTIMEYKKEYGYICNSFKTIKHISYSVTYDHLIVEELFKNPYFDLHKLYNEVVIELKSEFEEPLIISDESSTDSLIYGVVLESYESSD